MEHITLAQYWDMLNAHDWYYDMSDDHRVWRKGQEEGGKIATLATQSDAHEILLVGFRDHHFSGKPWETEQKPKPARPV